jgi:hypothetical protein
MKEVSNVKPQALDLGKLKAGWLEVEFLVWLVLSWKGFVRN